MSSILRQAQSKIIDVHSHVQFAAFTDEYQKVIDRALKVGVGMINVGTQKDTSQRAIEIAHEYKSDDIYATVGLHPIHSEKSYHDPKELGGEKGFTSRGEDFDYTYYKKLAQDSKVVAIGECGLDYYRLRRNPASGGGYRITDSDQRLAVSVKERQKELFLKHIALAQEVQKPLMIHCRPTKGTDNAYEDLLSIILNSKFVLPRIVHFYVGSLEITRKLVDAGFYFTFGGVITFARDYDESLKYIPLDRILLETYVAPTPYRGKRNEPVYIIETAKKFAELKEVPFDIIQDTIYNTTRTIFQMTIVFYSPQDLQVLINSPIIKNEAKLLID